jgi:glycosyltransferase involved in cell wall biosynthesis
MASILFLSSMNGGPWGGSEGLWSRAAARLAAEGHQVACAAFDWPEKAPRWAALRAAGCEVLPLPNWRRRKATALDRLVHEALAKPAQVLAVRRLPWRRFDHVAFSQGAWDELTTAPFRRLDALARSYSIAYHSYQEGATPRRLDDLRRLVRGARWNFFASERGRDVFADRLGIEPPDAAVLHNPLSFAVPEAEPAWPDPAGEGPLRLVGVGMLHHDTKAQDVLLDALGTTAWRARAWTLELYGEGPDRAAIEARARALGLAERIHLRGHTNDVAGALAGAQLLVQCSRVEAMPIAVHEAMAMARPAVVTRIGDMPRWIPDGETGFVAERADPGEVGRALEAAWRARPRLREMGRRAREVFLARFPRDPVGEFAGWLLDAAQAPDAVGSATGYAAGSAQVRSSWAR